MSRTKEQVMKEQKSRIKATVLTFAEELGIDMNEIPDYTMKDLEKFSLEEALSMGDVKLAHLKSLTVEGRATSEEVKSVVKGLAAILKYVEEKDKLKNRAEIAAKEH